MTAAIASGAASVADLLRSDACLGRLSGVRLAGLLAHAERRIHTPGTLIFSDEAPADALFRIVRGEVRIEETGAGPAPRDITRRDGWIGEEAMLGGGRYTARAIAAGEVETLVLPARALRELAVLEPGLRDHFFRSYAGRFDAAPQAVPARAVDAPPAEAGHVSAILGWLLAMALPATLYWIAPGLGLSPSATDFLAIIAATVCMWLFSLVPEYVPPLFAALAVILLDVAPPEQALSGFRSESFFMCLSVFGLGALMVSSGLTYRFALWVLGRVPPTQAGYNASLFGLGTVLSPIIPSVVGRVSIVAPFLIELVQISGAGARDRYANRLIYSLLGGSALLVPVFLTASVPNLVVYGLLDPQTQFAFDWMSWLWAASAYGVVMMLAFALVSGLFFRGARHFSVPRDIIRAQSRLLGPVSISEWLALLAVLTMTLGIMTEAVHGVNFPWVALAIFVTLLLFGSLKREALRAQIDWPVLVYIGAIVGWVPIAATTGLDDFVVAHLSWLGAHMADNLPGFVLMVSLVILLVRLALPTGVTVVLFVTALFPLAAAQGVSLWIVGFVILAIADTFIFPYQSSYYLKLRNDLTERGLGEVCDARRLVLANIALIAARIGALLVCLVFWSGLDLI